MSVGDCDRWMELTDQAAVGGCLNDRDVAWLSQHASVCRDCGAEKQFYASLGDALGRPEMLVVPSQAAVPAQARGTTRKPLLWGLALAAGLALVVGAALALRPSAPTASLPPPSPLAARVSFASGDAHLGSAPAQAGQSVPHGRNLGTGAGLACMGIADSIDVCLDAASTATFALSDPNQVLVYLDKGTLLARLDRQPAGRKFFVRTAGAEVQAVGTRFSVHSESDGSTRVRLHEGKLAVRSASRVSTDLEAPVQASIAQDVRVAPLSAADIAEDKALVDLMTLTHAAHGVSLSLGSTPNGADVLFDNVAIGKTPVSMFLANAAHVRLSAPGYQPVSDWIEVQGQTRIERTLALTDLPTAPAQAGDPASPRSVGARVSPAQLLARAQALRAQGQYRACARLYRRLWSEFPGSEEARVSMISLGELELVQSKDPAAALRAFNAYLRQGGPLEREARFGKIRALRALDREGDAAAESARFLNDYPTSMQAATLRQQSHGR